jgi:hypothetical protein
MKLPFYTVRKTVVFGVLALFIVIIDMVGYKSVWVLFLPSILYSFFTVLLWYTKVPGKVV